MSHINYVGRFAPSPTGPLHFGSLLTAIASYCDAKHVGGQWLVRIEDTDWQRNQPDSVSHILQVLDRFALQPDQPIRFQSQHLNFYQTVLDQLAASDLIYACACSRKTLQGTTLYPQHCRHLQLPFAQQALRLKVDEDVHIAFKDLRLDTFSEHVAKRTGDFILKRRDGILSYQLCVVADDALQHITHIVRGEDLLDNTARQIWLQKCLGYTTPQYLHLPLARNAQGQKLSKQNLALPLDLATPSIQLKMALGALGQAIPNTNRPADILSFAAENWTRHLIPQYISTPYR